MSPISSNPNFAAMDDAKLSPHHWKIMFISGMGFFTDAYDLFIIGVVMTLLKPICAIATARQVGMLPSRYQPSQ